MTYQDKLWSLAVSALRQEDGLYFAINVAALKDHIELTIETFIAEKKRELEASK